MWVCRDCDIRHGDGCEECKGCGGKREEVGAAFNPFEERGFQRNPVLKKRVRPWIVIPFLVLVPLFIYFQIVRNINREEKESRQLKDLEIVIDRVNLVLDKEDREAEAEGLGEDQKENFDYAKALVVDGMQIVLKIFSPEELNTFSRLMARKDKRPLTQSEEEEADELVGIKSDELTGMDKRKFLLMVKLMKIMYSDPAPEQKNALIVEIKALYRDQPMGVDQSAFSRITENMSAMEKLLIVCPRLAAKYLPRSETVRFAELHRKFSTLTSDEKKELLALIDKITAACNGDEAILMHAYTEFLNKML